MITCWIGYKFENACGMGYWKSRTMAVALSLFAHIIFYETPAVNFLLLFSKEYHFRFQADKYSAWLGMASGLLWGKLGDYMQWAHGYENDQRRRIVSIVQFCGGFGLIAFWYGLFGSIQDKYTYNPVHPYVFIFAVMGWLMIRNCTRYLTECHSALLEFLGRHTLETYVLQFHLFMTHNVQYIPAVIPGSGADGSAVLKFLNMLLCGSVFLTTAVFARRVTVATQVSVVDLVKNITGTMDTSMTQVVPQQSTERKDSEHESEETIELTKAESV
jgi:cell shape-determining protein MreD